MDEQEQEAFNEGKSAYENKAPRLPSLIYDNPSSRVANAFRSGYDSAEQAEIDFNEELLQ